MIDHFLTIEAPSEALLKEKSSKFFSYAFPVESTEDLELKLQALKKAHLKARHFCYAYILGADKQNFRANDDGEPSGTAGRPILGQLEKRGLVNTIVIVVRYFGGTKLGTSGLIKAYKESAAFALEEAKIVERIITGDLTISCSYEEIGPLMSVISAKGFSIVNVDYEALVTIILRIRLSKIDESVRYIKGKLLNRSKEDITKDTVVPNVVFIAP